MSIITVTSNADSGLGSLRGAIALAQAGDVIQFAANPASQTITLTSGQLIVDKNLTVDGAGIAGLTISGNNTSRIFDIRNDASYQPTTFTLRNLTIANGKTTALGLDGAGAGIRTATQTTLIVENSEFKNNAANGQGGGAIFAGHLSVNTVTNSKFDGNHSSNNGTSGKTERGAGAIATDSKTQLTVTGSEFINNVGTHGGAINTVLSALTVENSTFKNNDTTAAGAVNSETSGYGGAIYTDGASDSTTDSIGGTIAIRNSRFEGNRGAGQGGGLFLYAYPPDKVIVENNTIINNEVVADYKGDALGGGLRHGNGALEIRNTTFVNNKALQQGGGLWVGETSPVVIDNSTFYGNRAVSTDGKGGLGGAIALVNGSNPTNISNTTVADNYAGFQGGGFWGGGQSTTLTNTIVADNLANNGGNNWNIKHQTGTVFSDGGGNFQSLNPNPNDTKVAVGVTLLDPQLGAFTDNGGAVQTPPLPGNPQVLRAGASGSPPNPGNNSSLIGGTSGDDNILGSTSDQTIKGYAGNDTIDGAAGNDAVKAGVGNDTVTGNLGDDQLHGQDGDDTLNGGDGVDTLYGSSGIDTLNGGAGNDKLYGGIGNDVLNGNENDDMLSGQTGDDTLIGGTGNDNLVGGTGNDLLTGVNALGMNAGRGEIDPLTGGAGADQFQLGNATQVYYDDGVLATAGRADYAIVTDFNPLEDSILLHGAASDYQLGALTTGAGIYYTAGQTTNELVGIVRKLETAQLNLTASYFKYV